MKIYKVTMSTQNLSADGTGFYSTKEKALQAVELKKAVVLKYPDYYGDTDFDIAELDRKSLTGFELESIDTIIE